MYKPQRSLDRNQKQKWDWTTRWIKPSVVITYVCICEILAGGNLHVLQRVSPLHVSRQVESFRSQPMGSVFQYRDLMLCRRFSSIIQTPVFLEFGFKGFAKLRQPGSERWRPMGNHENWIAVLVMNFNGFNTEFGIFNRGQSPVHTRIA